MAVSPIEVQKALRGLEYPASRDDILTCAQENEPAQDVFDALQALPDQDYEGPTDVNAALGNGSSG